MPRNFIFSIQIRLLFLFILHGNNLIVTFKNYVYWYILVLCLKRKHAIAKIYANHKIILAPPSIVSFNWINRCGWSLEPTAVLTKVAGWGGWSLLHTYCVCQGNTKSWFMACASLNFHILCFLTKRDTSSLFQIQNKCITFSYNCSH